MSETLDTGVWSGRSLRVRAVGARAGVVALVTTLGSYIQTIARYIDALTFTGNGDLIAVEGAERGTMHDAMP